MYEFDYLEWDEEKRLSNLEKHKLDFEDAWQVFGDKNCLTAESPRNSELRYKTIGWHKRELVVVIHVPREQACRIISMRKSRAKEREEYHGNR